MATMQEAIHAEREPQSGKDYAELKRRVKAAGLLERQSGYYVFKFSMMVLLMAVGLSVIFLTDNIWLLVLDAVYMGFVYGQLSGTAHDIAHHQVFRDSPRTRLASYINGNLGLGMSFMWWYEKHNAHHSHPNDVEHDPDVDFPVIAFTETQALEKRGIFRWVVAHQVQLFFPMLTFEAYNMRFHSLRVLVQDGSARAMLELGLIAVHYAWYLALLFTQLSAWQAVLFLAVHHAAWSIYLGLIFAPNHKGMPYQDENQRWDFLRAQVLTSRNVSGHPLTDFFYNGLNYQIEHHLFPSMPRNKLRLAQPIVKEFCAEYDIPYYETSIWQAHRELMTHLGEISSVLHEKQPT